MIVGEVNQIREIEKLKEKELREAQRQANQILLDMEKKIELSHNQALQDAEKKAEETKDKRIKDAQKEVEKILKNYQLEAETLKNEISQRIPRVVDSLIEKVWQEYGN